VPLKPAAVLSSGAVLFTSAAPLKRITQEVLDKMAPEDVEKQILRTWQRVNKILARLGFGLSCFHQGSIFRTESEDMVILPCGPLAVLDQPYSDSCAQSVAVGESMAGSMRCCSMHRAVTCAS
jgi:hypothetical protein